ncbi:MAG: hypothetical protein RR518_07600 [Coprobacillus sp.]
MTNDIKVWKRLYELSEELKELKPWEHMWSSDYICIEISPQDQVYCIIMGKNKECIGISVYEGESGYGDLVSIDKSYNSSEVRRYVMYEQNCLTWYLGDRDEVLPQQMEIIKELGLKYHGKNAWPFFVCYEKQYYPYTFNDQEAKRFVIVLERLIDVLKDYIDDKIDVNFDDKEMIYVHQENENWIYEAMSLPESYDKYTAIELSDESIYTQLKKQKKTSDELYIDLHYMNSSIEDKQYKKPANALMFLVVDARSQMIVHCELLKPVDDEISVVLNYIIPYILEDGIPSKIYVRNPTVFVAIDNIANECGICLDMNDFSVIDNIYNDMLNMMK